jgi:hypothetical protein
LRPLDFDDSNQRKTGMASSHFQPRSPHAAAAVSDEAKRRTATHE